MGLVTQQDPIGIAGGLNLYGYANGDPVNFSDPFGLCPEKDRDDDGICPGGLSVEQWQEVEEAARRVHSLSERSSNKAEYGAYVHGTATGEGYMDLAAWGGGSNVQLVGTAYHGNGLPQATPSTAVALVHSHPYGLAAGGGRTVGSLRPSRADQMNAIARGIPVFTANQNGMRMVLPTGELDPRTWPLYGVVQLPPFVGGR
jgi:uncharacterized protein RhaS with RHS repeats